MPMTGKPDCHREAMNGRCLEVYDTKQAVARPFRIPFQKVAQNQGGVLSLEAGFSRGLRDMEQHASLKDAAPTVHPRVSYAGFLSGW